METKQEGILHEKLHEYFGFTSFKGNQEAVINNVLAGKDTFVLMPTGGGKSLCYQLPALIMDGVAIVISPLIALMKNQVDAMRTFSTESGIAHFLNSSLNKSAIAQVRQDVLEGRTKLLYFAPESLTKEEGIAWDKVNVFHMDEYIGISIDREQSFARFVKTFVADRLHVGAFYPLNGAAECIEDECQRYTNLLRTNKIDIVCLGIGENGHIAFNDPGEADFFDEKDTQAFLQ